MKHSGRARKASFKLILITLIAGALLWGLLWLGSVIAMFLLTIAVPVLVGLWVLFSIFTLYFFRDPDPTVPAGPNRSATLYRDGKVPAASMGRELRGSTLGVIGYGAIGKEVVRLGRALGMRAAQ